MEAALGLFHVLDYVFSILFLLSSYCNTWYQILHNTLDIHNNVENIIEDILRNVHDVKVMTDQNYFFLLMKLACPVEVALGLFYILDCVFSILFFLSFYYNMWYQILHNTLDIHNNVENIIEDILLNVHDVKFMTDQISGPVW